MGSTLYGIDIVDIGMEILAVSCVVHDGHLDGHTLLLCAEIDDIIKEMSTTAIHEANEVAQASLAVIFLCAGSTLLIGTKVGKCDGDTGIQISQLAHTVGQHIEIIGGGGEDAPIGPELLTCATQVRLAHHLHGIESLATGIFLLIDLSITEHLGKHMGGEGIHTTDTHTMETAAHLITALVELTTGMQNGHHHLKGTDALLLMDVHGDTATVVLNGDAIVFVDSNLDMGAITCQSLVDRVVHSLIHQMM